MRRAALLLTALAGSVAAAACPIDDVAGTRIESERYRLVFSPVDAALGVGQHFDLRVTVCLRAGGPYEGPLRADATMPGHGHGMNYRVETRALGEGRYRVEGYLLHMPGEWEFAFGLGEGANREWLTVPYRL